MEDMYSDFLYARPSFLEGIARITDMGDTLNEYNASENPDAVALMGDWFVVGQAMRQAMEDFESSEIDDLELVG